MVWPISAAAGALLAICMTPTGACGGEPTVVDVSSRLGIDRAFSAIFAAANESTVPGVAILCQKGFADDRDTLHFATLTDGRWSVEKSIDTRLRIRMLDHIAFDRRYYLLYAVLEGLEHYRESLIVCVYDQQRRQFEFTKLATNRMFPIGKISRASAGGVNVGFLSSNDDSRSAHLVKLGDMGAIEDKESSKQDTKRDFVRTQNSIVGFESAEKELWLFRSPIDPDPIAKKKLNLIGLVTDTDGSEALVVTSENGPLQILKVLPTGRVRRVAKYSTNHASGRLKGGFLESENRLLIAVSTEAKDHVFHWLDPDQEQEHAVTSSPSLSYSLGFETRVRIQPHGGEFLFSEYTSLFRPMIFD